ncbi:MAG: polymer-forming cytoskeletal protein [Patescibacteria group bacterium]
MKFWLVLLVSMVALDMGAGAARAQDDAPGPSAEPEDFFSFVAEVRVPEQGARDVVAAGGVVDINNPVEQDVLALGGTVIIQAQVSGDARVAGRLVVIRSDIGGNLAVLAERVEIAADATISGSVEIRAKDVVIDGTILGDAHIVSETLSQNGTISGELTHDPVTKPDRTRSPLGWFFRIVSLFGMLVVGLVLVTLFPNSIRKAVHGSIKNPGRDFLWGLAVFAATPIAALVLVLTIIGLPLGLLAAVGYAMALYLANIMVGLVLGTYLVGAIRGREHAQKASLVAIMALGVFAFWLITGIPGIGVVLKLVAMIWGLGLLLNLTFRALKTLEA